VLLLAGSGPTDRDWNSPLLPGKNGSARQLAEALSGEGLVVLRFDKAFSGKNGGPPIAELTLDTYQVEARAALALLRSRPEVDGNRIFVAGSSEGGVHATRLALTERKALAGIIFLAGPGRSIREILVTQLTNNFQNAPNLTPDQVEAQMKPIRDGLAAFVAGEDVDPKTLSQVPQIQGIFTALMSGPTAGLGRALVSFEPRVEAAKVEVPILVFQGGKDIQVDPVLDADRLVAALRGAKRDVTYHLSPNANHVLKHEPKSVSELRADPGSVQNAYSADGIPLEADVVPTLVAWIRAKGK
jgi:pimeloyl-ACP methyl ester carboxylesterase